MHSFLSGTEVKRRGVIGTMGTRELLSWARVPASGLVLACVVMLTSCGDDEGEGPLSPRGEAVRVATVEVSPSSVLLTSVGSGAELTAVAKDAGGRVVEGVHFVWQSSDPSVVVVDTEGRLVSKGPGSAVVTAVADGVPGHASVEVTQTAKGLSFVVQPGDGVAGVALSPAIPVEIVDEAGRRVSGATDAVALSLVAENGAELVGTRVVNAVGGVATFSGLVVERAGSGYRVRASVGELEPAESEAFSIAPGAAVKLGFLEVPEEVVAGESFEVRVGVQDAYGNVVPEASGKLALQLAAGPEGAELKGSVLEAEAEGGVAVFAVVLEKADDGYVLGATSPGYESGRSERLRVVAGEPFELAFIDPPDSVHLGVAHTYTLGVVDQLGNRVRAVESTDVRIKDNTLTMVDGELSFTYTFMDPRDLVTAVAVDQGWRSARLEPRILLRWSQFVAGHDRTCGITVNSVLLCWGNSARGKLGRTGGLNEYPYPVSGNRRWRSVAIGSDHTCAIDTGGTAYCWGSNEYGQLGINDPSVAEVTEPRAVDTTQRFREIAAGEYHTCGVTTNSNVLCWGRNNLGQLGTGSSGGMAYAPTPIDSDLGFNRITAGGSHTCAIRDSSVLAAPAYCWGYNGFGQLGNGNRTLTAVPDSVRSPHRFRAIVAGTYHTCGIVDDFGDDLIRCWGRNDRGQLGIGPDVPMDSLPRSVLSFLMEGATITAGSNHTCVISRPDSRPYCWGANETAQLGTGDLVNQSYPAAVAGDHVFDLISAGSSHTCALREGVAYCWGSNLFGRIGWLMDGIIFLPRQMLPNH